MTTDFQYAIVGAGFAGIIAALRLKQSGRENFVILEKASEVGGTWRDNVYPGCACDVPSILYSISFAPNPDWNRLYPPRAEILEYLKSVAKKSGVDKHIRYDADICRSEFIENGGYWKLTDRKGRILTARMIISATGPFNRPRIPDFQGLETFQGKTLHSARWDNSVDLQNKRVAIIGTGASAIQIVPTIAPEVAQLTVFQRTPAWISNRMDHEVSEKHKAHRRKYPIYQKFLRGLLYWFLELRGNMFLGNKTIQKIFRNFSLKKYEREVRDPEIRAKLIPKYEFGCKRILSSDDYLPTFNRPNVALETSPIDEITKTGILTKDGKQHNFEVIIFATGFEVAEITTDEKVIGLHGRELFAQWKNGNLEAYKGTTISGFPNLCFILGPNTGLGHSSMIHIMESQANYVMKYVELLDSQGENAFLDLKPEIQRSYNEDLQKKFAGTVWTSGCKSWYANAEGKITTLYPRLTYDFRQKTMNIDGSEYNLVKI